MGSIKGSRFQVLVEPRITEKAASMGSAGNTVVFSVHPKANKSEIRDAVEKIFSVKVESVRTITTSSKLKRARYAQRKHKTWKKAYITLQPGSSIDIIEGL